MYINITQLNLIRWLLNKKRLSCQKNDNVPKINSHTTFFFFSVFPLCYQI